jgi:hypothetical protein
MDEHNHRLCILWQVFPLAIQEDEEEEDEN